MRNTRTHRRNTALAVAAVAALSLGLTACGGDDKGTRDEGAATHASAPAEAGASSGSGTGGSTTAGGDASAAPGKAGGTSGSGGGSAGGSAGGGTGTGAKTAAAGGGKTPSCTFQDVRVTAAKADETPTEHIVLTAVNKSSRACRLDGYPLIAFGQIQTAKDIPAVAKSKPAAPVVLQPGAPAYANVRVVLGGVHEDNKVVDSFNVNLFTGTAPTEGSIVVKAPAGGIAVDEAVAKTGYWTPELRNGADEF
ncbi:DUF4232 domain-containing protein [Streptomyces sp. NPDC014779]|uniref:DUF4232 domain-containing protein n=1 Tax=unclassified Streptomyces TaxID=2593676 RepID=UPI0036F60BF5